uniref:Uncharacterized protein n=1 Tax=Cuerna arida TaxID=1464854 RepID=A0A1B6FSE6_9HEMI
MGQLHSAQEKQEVENTETLSGNMDHEEVTSESSVSNSGEESPTSDLIDSSGEDESQPMDQENSGTTETSSTDSSEEPQRSARKKRSILDAPLLDCPEGQARDFLGNCRPVF